MHWIVQNNLYNEEGFDKLLETLDRFQIKKTIVKVIPFSHELEPDINPDGPIFVCGSLTLGKIAKERGWSKNIGNKLYQQRWVLRV